MKILITSALPYANGPLHFGHIAGAYLPADCYARFERLMKNEVLYICGSDEYGVAITLSADMAKRSPQEHVDIYHKVNEELFKRLDFSFDHFSRTTWEGHVSTVQQFFTDLLAKGYIEDRVTQQLYSDEDQRFLADRYVVGTCPTCHFDKARGDECQSCGASYEATDLLNPRSKLTGSQLTKKDTKHWFLRFDLFKDQLKEWIEKKSWKANVINFAKSYIDDLKPRAITRDGDWGVPIPLPGTQGKILYVWFDAPIGYISATKEWAEKQGTPEAWRSYWLESDTKYVQFIGKDNIPFHAVFFPAMTMGQNQPYKTVDELPANEFLNLEGKQFSKSDGWTIDLERFFNQFSSDQIRYTLAANAPETQDSEFSWKDFQNRCNVDLLGKYGNLANRVLVFIQNKQSTSGNACIVSSDIDKEFFGKLELLFDELKKSYQTFQLRKASQLIMDIATQGNIYFDSKKPWQLAKDPVLKQELDYVIYNCLNCLKILAVGSYPIIPEAAQKLWQMLGFTTDIKNEKWSDITSSRFSENQFLPKPSVIFKRVEDEAILLEIDYLKSILPSK